MVVQLLYKVEGVGQGLDDLALDVVQTLILDLGGFVGFSVFGELLAVIK